MKRAKACKILRNSRRGSYIMEASIVLPMIILTVITVVLIIMFFYSQVTEQSRLHIALRSEAGAAAGNDAGGAGESISEAEIYVDEGAVTSEAYGKKYLLMKNSGILDGKKTFTVEGSWSAVDGAAYVRYMNFVKGIVK